MRKTQTMETPQSEFPNLARLLGSEADDGASIRERIRSTLAELEAEEQKTERAQKSQGVVPDRPFAKVAMILLGLTPRAAHKTIGKRRALAAPVRGVAPRTMRKHQPEIAQQLAAHLCAEANSRRGTPRLAPIAVTYASLSALGYEDCEAMLAELDPAQARGLFRGLARSYDAFVAALALNPQWFTAPAGTATTLFTALRRLGERGFQDERVDLPRRKLSTEPVHGLRFRVMEYPHSHGLLTLRHQVMWLTVCAEASEESRYALAVAVLCQVDRLLPAYSLAERQHLERVAKEADGHDFRFVEEMERSEVGRRILSTWAALSSCRCDAGVEGASRQDAMRRGFRLMVELLDPGSGHQLDRKDLNRYLATAGGTDPLIPYMERVEEEADYAGHIQWLMAEKGKRVLAYESFAVDVRSRGDTETVVW